jgi:hypothetical protein
MWHGVGRRDKHTRIFVGKPVGKRPSGRGRHRWGVILKRISKK